MQPHNRANQFFAMAKKDFNALKAMTDDIAFSNEIFGFHAQQAVEKCLKAWLEFVGGTAPITHNLILLLTMLEDADVDVSEWWDLVELTSFAVQYRYEQLDISDADIDRSKIIARVNAILNLVSTSFNLS